MAIQLHSVIGVSGRRYQARRGPYHSRIEALGDKKLIVFPKASFYLMGDLRSSFEGEQTKIFTFSGYVHIIFDCFFL
jgi:hypothetical protein